MIFRGSSSPKLIYNRFQKPHAAKLNTRLQNLVKKHLNSHFGKTETMLMWGWCRYFKQKQLYKVTLGRKIFDFKMILMWGWQHSIFLKKFNVCIRYIFIIRNFWICLDFILVMISKACIITWIGTFRAISFALRIHFYPQLTIGLYEIPLRHICYTSKLKE